jgi:hypothetical protein
MKKLKVCPGVCGLEALITVESEDGMEATVQVESKCPAVQKMAAALEQPVDAYEACFVKPGEGPVYEAAKELQHGACPMPSAVLKCIEAECNLALPRDVSMTFV